MAYPAPNVEEGSIVVEVVSLEGEKIALKVPESIRGMELRKMIAARVAAKPGASVAVLFEASLLSLSETLAQQGISGCRMSMFL